MVLSDKNLDMPVYIPVILGLSALMISNIKYPNFKGVSRAQGLKLFALASLTALIIAFKSNPGQMIFLYHAGYVLSGIVMLILKQAEGRLNPIVERIIGK
jgi:phosphatidylserine synthase